MGTRKQFCFSSPEERSFEIFSGWGEDKDVAESDGDAQCYTHDISDREEVRKGEEGRGKEGRMRRRYERVVRVGERRVRVRVRGG